MKYSHILSLFLLIIPIVHCIPTGISDKPTEEQKENSKLQQEIGHCTANQDSLSKTEDHLYQENEILGKFLNKPEKREANYSDGTTPNDALSKDNTNQLFSSTVQEIDSREKREDPSTVGKIGTPLVHHCSRRNVSNNHRILFTPVRQDNFTFHHQKVNDGGIGVGISKVYEHPNIQNNATIPDLNSRAKKPYPSEKISKRQLQNHTNNNLAGIIQDTVDLQKPTQNDEIFPAFTITKLSEDEKSLEPEAVQSEFREAVELLFDPPNDLRLKKDTSAQSKPKQAEQATNNTLKQQQTSEEDRLKRGLDKEGDRQRVTTDADQDRIKRDQNNEKTKHDKVKSSENTTDDEILEEDDDDDEELDESSMEPRGSKRDLHKEAHKMWDSWSSWSPCSVSCGAGKVTRWRHCIGGNCAPGEKEAQIKTCVGPQCD